MADKKNLFRLIDWIQEQGWKVEKTRNGHYRIFGPQGPIVLPSTPGEGRSWQNSVAQLRRNGIDVPRK